MEGIQPLYDKQITCPFCSNTYHTKRVRSRFIKPLHTDADFCTTYEDETLSPLLYGVYVCPSCGYSFSDQSTPILAKQDRERLNSQLVNRWAYQDFSGERTVEDAVHTIKLAIYTGSLKKEKAIVLAGLALRLVWLYRKRNDHINEKRFIHLSERLYKQAYAEDDALAHGMSPLKILYLIGELNRRLGNDKAAIQYFSKVVDNRKNTFDPKIIEMARNQWYLIRDKRKRSLRSSG
ncbi:DUF2225 domain-containing protein [Pontibacillus salicampi]|uniref:DUF2225 domain-containing protein n=1 Tax=Pontibacillus salicampi TaxID=1449801 RepID=A0ABV6LN94_9BACI